ncbi:MAG TPA: winged helix-turn-helix domain-containing protein [Sphingomicrobium sp.]|nr:winged helix-turn-helix domain-containing protein [Sphingomicrobium sp.]
MDERVGDRGLLTTAELAGRADFWLGDALISPSMRTVRGSAGQAEVAPREMQVLLVLADAAGSVVTRDTLFRRCWGNRQIGGDSLNRAIGGVRRIASAAGSFEVETIPRTGYRLIVRSRGSSPLRVGEGTPGERSAALRSRRAVITGAAAAAAIGGLGLWSVRHSQEERRFNELMDKGERALSYGDPSNDGAEYFRRAAAMRPDDAKAQGLLASILSTRAEYGNPSQAGAALQGAERAARAALVRDSNEPNARVALIVLQRSVLDFATTEDRLRAILATAPGNPLAMRHMWGLLQSTGQSRAAFAMIERAIALEPLAALNHYPRAQLLWILGRTAEADRVIDRAMQYWPEHELVRFARFTIYAYTGRARAALAMLNDAKTRPHYSPDEVSLWRVSLAALDERTPASIAAARSANLEAAKQNPIRSNIAILVLSALGEIDAAFDIANQLLLFRDSVGPGAQAGAAKFPAKSTSWRFAPWLFTPPVEPMQADPRFKALCDGIGLTDYWAKRGIRPDYQLRNS